MSLYGGLAQARCNHSPKSSTNCIVHNMQSNMILICTDEFKPICAQNWDQVIVYNQRSGPQTAVCVCVCACVCVCVCVCARACVCVCVQGNFMIGAAFYMNAYGSAIYVYTVAE